MLHMMHDSKINMLISFKQSGENASHIFFIDVKVHLIKLIVWAQRQFGRS